MFGFFFCWKAHQSIGLAYKQFNRFINWLRLIHFNVFWPPSLRTRFKCALAKLPHLLFLFIRLIIINLCYCKANCDIYGGHKNGRQSFGVLSNDERTKSRSISVQLRADTFFFGPGVNFHLIHALLLQYSVSFGKHYSVIDKIDFDAINCVQKQNGDVEHTNTHTHTHTHTHSQVFAYWFFIKAH